MNEKGIPGRGNSRSKDKKWSVRAEQEGGKVGEKGVVRSLQKTHWVGRGKYSEHSLLELCGSAVGEHWCLVDRST